MSKNEIIKPYKNESEFSYVSGAYGAIEILKSKPELVKKVFIHSAYTNKDGLLESCKKAGVTAAFSDEAFRRVNQKENSYVLTVFDKYVCRLSAEKPHVVLVNPGDMGNLGTIIRTMTGFNLANLAIITPAADIFHPKTIRASMGALFHISFKTFFSFEEYRNNYPDHQCFPFMLDGNELPVVLPENQNPLFSLIFGNEATGLDREYAALGRAVKIPQSDRIDSLNISVAFGIGAYTFAKGNGLI